MVFTHMLEGFKPSYFMVLGSKRSSQKKIQSRRLTVHNSSPLRNDRWKTILSFWVPKSMICGSWTVMCLWPIITFSVQQWWLIAFCNQSSKQSTHLKYVSLRFVFFVWEKSWSTFIKGSQNIFVPEKKASYSPHIFLFEMVFDIFWLVIDTSGTAIATFFDRQRYIFKPLSHSRSPRPLGVLPGWDGPMVHVGTDFWRLISIKKCNVRKFISNGF